MKALEMVFKGVDKGTESTLNKIAGGFGSVVKSISSTVKESKTLSQLNNIIGSINMHRLGEIGANLKSVGDAVTEGVSGGADAVKELERQTGRLAASSLIPQQVMKKMFQDWRATTVKPFGEAQETFEGIMRTFKTFGTDSEKWLRAFTNEFMVFEEFGANTQSTAQMVGTLTGTFGRNIDQIKQMISNWGQWAQQGSIADDVLKSMPETIDVFSKQLSGLIGNHVDVNRVMEETVKLGARISKTFRDPRGYDAARDMMKTVIDLQNQWQSAISAGDKIPEEWTNLAGLLHKSMQEMSVADPTTIIEAMANATKNAGDMTGYYRSKFLPLLPELVRWTQRGKELENIDFSKPFAGVDQASQWMAKLREQTGATTRTTQELLQIYREHFDQNVAALIWGKEGNFRKRAKEGFDTIFKYIDKYAQKAGIFGDLTRAFIAFQSGGGFGGALSQLGSFTPMMAQLSAAFGGFDLAPIVTGLASMGVGVKQMVLLGGAGWMLNKALKASNSSLGELLNNFSDLWNRGDYVGAIESAVGTAFRALLKYIPTVLSAVITSKEFHAVIKAMADMTMDTIRTGISQLVINAPRIGMAIGSAIIDVILDQIKNISGGIFGGFGRKETPAVSGPMPVDATDYLGSFMSTIKPKAIADAAAKGAAQGARTIAPPKTPMPFYMPDDVEYQQMNMAPQVQPARAPAVKPMKAQTERAPVQMPTGAPLSDAVMNNLQTSVGNLVAATDGLSKAAGKTGKTQVEVKLTFNPRELVKILQAGEVLTAG